MRQIFRQLTPSTQFIYSTVFAGNELFPDNVVIFASTNQNMSKIVYITRRERFNAAHKLWNEKWDDETNHRTFGKCANPNWHGHNYDLFVTVKGVPDPDTGYCIDLKFLSDVIEERVLAFMDHRNLNLDVPFLKGKMTSCENVAIAIWDQLEAPLKNHNCDLYSVKLYETENNIVEYFGGK